MTSLYITESGAYLHKRGGHVVIGRNNEVLLEVPLERIEDVTLMDSVRISSKLLTEFMERNVPLSWLSGLGKFYGTLFDINSVDIFKQEQQFKLLEERNTYDAIAKKVVLAKVHNQLTILRRYNRNIKSEEIGTCIKNILAIRKNIFSAGDYRKLMGYEGIISRVYFSALALSLPEEFKFSKRTKMPPKDPVNSMLSLGYSMLFNETLAAIVASGLHPHVGFLHRIAKGHPALVSDLMEEWRAVLIDSLVLNMIKRNMITYEMFEFSDQGCFLNTEARKIFLSAYNKKLKSANQYLDNKNTFRESIKQQCRKYCNAIMSTNADIYTPIELR